MNSYHELLDKATKNNAQHARFLNTLSLLEFTGARLISSCIEYLPKDLFTLEHINEEYRHAYYLRKLALKLSSDIKDYKKNNTISPIKSAHYLRRLNIEICKILKTNLSLNHYQFINAVYLLTTYAVEVRALEFYTQYQDILDKKNIEVNVKSIVSEEKDHLDEIEHRIQLKEPLIPLKRKVLEVENKLFSLFKKRLIQELL